MTPRAALLRLGSLLLLSVALPRAESDAGVCDRDLDGTCKVDFSKAGSPSIRDDDTDGIAHDITQFCPLADSGRGQVFTWFFSLLKKTTGVLQMINLWPKGVAVANWTDDYFVVNYLIVARTLLGLYKTRSKDYVYIPTRRITDAKDIAHVEYIYAPHFDPDGSPNFYWFESLLPSFIMEMAYVPMMTCFYSSLRKLGTDNNFLNGTFDDMLDDETKNTWDVVLRASPYKTRKDWVMSFYDMAHSWDGKPLWPKQMTDFSTYFKKDEWDDQLEQGIAFSLIGTHRVESGSWKFESVGALPFRIPLNIFSAFEVRKHFGKYGVDLYFNADGLPVLLETTDGKVVKRGDKDWQYWKFVWRSTLVTGVTLVDHLHMTHFRAANLLARVTRVALPGTHPLRRVLSIFSFGSIFVNIQALHQLVGPNHMLHRASPFKDFSKLSRSVPDVTNGILDDLPDVPGVKALTHEDTWNALHPMLKETPYYADGRLLMTALKKFAGSLCVLLKPILCDSNGLFTPEIYTFRQEFLNETLQGHYKYPKEMLDTLLGCEDFFTEFFKKRMIVYFFVVTGWHRQVGFVGDYYKDPSLATMSWKDGEPFGRPNQHMIMTIINVFTSSNQPLLKEDYSHLFKGMEPDLEGDFVNLWRAFQEDLLAVEKEIDLRNSKRKIVNINMNPRVLEGAVSK